MNPDPTPPSPAPAALRERHAELRSRQPHLRARDAARALGVSECELVAAQPDVTRLDERWREMFAAFPTLGEAMALTRNEAVVSEVIGIYSPPEFMGERGPGQVAGEPIDLRMFLNHWAFGLAVREPFRGATRRSLQFFDARGDAVHKIFLRDDARAEAFDALVAAHRHPIGAADIACARGPAPVDPTAARVDRDALREAWSKLPDAHAFFGLLRTFGLEREEALRRVGAPWAEPVDRASLRAVLEAARDAPERIMVFVGNDGMLQVFSGEVRRVVVVDGWTNVLDPTFNLHAQDALIARAWRVRKPSGAGVVTSLELYDASGRNVALVFGKRGAREDDPPGWRAIIDALPTAP